ncbi:MAG: hypothetical protein K2M16_04435, partial [Muribaculaceae bacterium]|nr:hypothetical protein [Muribaculaceae bacterium]
MLPTEKTHDFLGHKMLLIADGDRLTRCKWILPGAEYPDSTHTRHKGGVIADAISQISEYLSG